MLNEHAQQRHGFCVGKLPDFSTLSENPLAEALIDNTRTEVPEQVCFRIDFPSWLGTRDRHAIAGSSTTWQWGSGHPTCPRSTASAPAGLASSAENSTMIGSVIRTVCQVKNDRGAMESKSPGPERLVRPRCIACGFAWWIYSSIQSTDVRTIYNMKNGRNTVKGTPAILDQGPMEAKAIDGGPELLRIDPSFTPLIRNFRSLISMAPNLLKLEPFQTIHFHGTFELILGSG